MWTMATELSTKERTDDWRSAWPDALAFVVWLGVAWYSRWTARDLVWSLWLSSLVVGYATIVWTILRPGVMIARTMLTAPPEAITVTDMNTGKKTQLLPVVGYAIVLFIGLFVLGFFTVHFGGFHYVHSQFLHGFFPLDGNPTADSRLVGGPDYAEVFRRYWTFLPAAFLAERAGFARPPAVTKDDLSVTPAAIAARKAANARKGGAMLAPYRNVLRMHFLIFFFAFAHFTNLDNVFVYTVVYAAYFFPWRLLKKQGAREAAIEVW